MSKLLEHREWVERLAHALVRDAATADDLAQEVWLKSLTARPRDAGAARSWLRRLLINGAHDRRRGERRRLMREQASARPEAIPSVGRQLAREELNQIVAEAVLALDEPYRSTLLQRYWENLPPREVAAIQGVPVETVRTRVKRGIRLLRGRLTGGAGLSGVVTGGHFSHTGSVGAYGAGAGTGILGGVSIMAKSWVGGVILGALVGALAATSLAGGQTTGVEPEDLQELQTELSDLRLALHRDDATASEPVLLGRESARPAPGAERRLAAVEAELRSTRRAVDSLAHAHATMQRSDAARLERLSRLSTEDLLAEIRSLVSRVTPPYDGEGIVVAADLLLARRLESTTRADGLIMKGIGHRMLKDEESERAAFTEAREAAGRDSQLERQASYQLAWTDARAGKHDEAAMAFRRLSAHPATSVSQQAWYRYYAAGELASSGHGPAAERDYQWILDTHDETEEPELQAVVEVARAALERISRGR